MARRIAREEALFAGTSSGANVLAAIKVAERLGPDARVVTLMVDSGLRTIWREQNIASIEFGSLRYRKDDSVNIIETDRLILRTWNESDLHPFVQMNQDPQVMEFFPQTLSAEETEGLFRRISTFLEEKGFGLFAAETRQTQEFLGFIGLSVPTFTAHFTPCVEIGWRLARRFWKQGYATEGARACLNYGFSVLTLREIVSFTSKLNTRSIDVMERIGMRYRGEFDHPNLEQGHPLRTHVLYTISGPS